ncbi:hypothetical protein [Streptosporangium canum]|uniref:hypothetical protein n=1 Tax=Streptosporangium canum TaxID=324952 RepID=UPI0037927C8F
MPTAPARRCRPTASGRTRCRSTSPTRFWLGDPRRSLCSPSMLCSPSTEDVDIFDADDVLWAMQTRMQGNRGIITIPGVAGHVRRRPGRTRGAAEVEAAVADQLRPRVLRQHRVGIEGPSPPGQHRFSLLRSLSASNGRGLGRPWLMRSAP